jgi:hypothetical protein
MTIKKYFGNDFMIVKYVFLIYELYNKSGLIKFPEAKIEKKHETFNFVDYGIIVEIIFNLVIILS